MATAEIRYLREAAKEQARMYRQHVKKLNQLRNDPYMDQGVKRQILLAHLASTRAQYAEMERDVQAKAQAIRSRVIPKVTPNDIARSDVRYMLGKNMKLHEIGRFAVEQKRPELLAALREIAPMLAVAHDLPDQGNATPEHALQQAMSMVESFERQFATPQEQALYEEQNELAMSIAWIEDNFKSIGDDLHHQESTGESLLRELRCWPGLPGQGQYKGPISLTAEGVA